MSEPPDPRLRDAMNEFYSHLSEKIPRFNLLLCYTTGGPRDSRLESCSGVYLLFGYLNQTDESLGLQYVGTAECFSKRLWSRDKVGRFIWDEAWVYTVEEPYGFLRHSLEAFLIRRLSPPHHRGLGVRRRVKI